MEKKKRKRRRETTPHSTPMGFKYKIDAYIGVSITVGRSDGGCREQSNRVTDRPTVLEPAQSEMPTILHSQMQIQHAHSFKGIRK